MNETKTHWEWDREKEGKPIILVDFDHTITSTCKICASGMGTPQDIAVVALHRLHKDYSIIIWSGRPFGDYFKVKKYLNEWCIPYDDIILDKPLAMFIIDDRAIQHVNWKATLAQVNSRNEGEKFGKELEEEKR